MPIRVDAHKALGSFAFFAPQPSKGTPRNVANVAGAVTGKPTPQEAQAALPRLLLEDVKNRTAKPKRTVENGPGQSEKAATARSLGAALRNTNKGISFAHVADEGLAEIEVKLLELRDLADAATSTSLTGDARAALGVQFQAIKKELDEASSAATFGGIPLLDGTAGTPGSTITTAIPTPGKVTAVVAQTQPLLAQEVLTFEDFGVFAGRSLGQRKITLAAGSTQQQVVDAINTNANTKDYVKASVSEAGKLVLTSVDTGGDANFKVSSDKAAASNSTGIGTSILSGFGTDTVTSAAKIKASVAQTNNLNQAETLTFQDLGLFAGLSATNRTISLAQGSSQQTVVNAINNHATIGKLVTAGVENGKLTLSSKEQGGNRTFAVVSSRSASQNSTGLGTAVLQAYGTSGEPAPAFVRASTAQTQALGASETLTFQLSAAFVTALKANGGGSVGGNGGGTQTPGIGFAGTENPDGTFTAVFTLQAGLTQQQIIGGINSSEFGIAVTASSDALGRLLVTGDLGGSSNSFTVQSNRAPASNSTGIGTSLLRGNNGVNVVYETITTPGSTALEPLQVDTGVDAGDRFTLEFSEATIESLGLKDVSLASVTKATESLAKIDQALGTVQKQRIQAQTDQNQLEATADRLAGRLTDLLPYLSPTQQVESARLLAQREATRAVVAQANVKPESALKLLE